MNSLVVARELNGMLGSLSLSRAELCFTPPDSVDHSDGIALDSSLPLHV
jgi:hypothetical protein